VRTLASALVAVVLLAACGASSHQASTGPSSSASVGHIRLSSPAFAAGATIPVLYTCQGRDVSLPLSWSGVPAGTTQLKLTMRDPDAPGGTFLHWSLSGLPPATTRLATAEVPAGAVQAPNDFGTRGYGGPCPPPGDKPHRYVITLSALSGDRVLATGTLTGTYARR
jgi:Raf kinase inhibitor-like YbhB/YbcL family protein